MVATPSHCCPLHCCWLRCEYFALIWRKIHNRIIALRLFCLPSHCICISLHCAPVCVWLFVCVCVCIALIESLTLLSYLRPTRCVCVTCYYCRLNCWCRWSRAGKHFARTYHLINCIINKSFLFGDYPSGSYKLKGLFIIIFAVAFFNINLTVRKREP